MSATATVGDLQIDDEQEIRVAAVLNGGVSLAVWISGVVLELHHLALASQGLGTWTPYKRVLDLLGATARIDVVAGTSAGGLNGAFLALGLARRRDLRLLRDLWTDQGSFEALLRPALAKNPPSLLQGDDYFLVKMREALAATVGPDNAALQTDASALPPPSIELILTGTLWTGRESTFTDDMGVGITERDYDATFRFANKIPPEFANKIGDLDDVSNSVVEQLARAARCTSSFPAAFEPHYVTTQGDGAADLRWASTAGGANFGTDQYVLDGGILLNKPIRPALEAIYRQTGENQVRRVLAYVVPDPGEPPNANDGPLAPETQGPVPNAAEVVLAILTRLRSTDSVSRELGEIRDRNKAVAERKRARARLSFALSSTSPQVDHRGPARGCRDVERARDHRRVAALRRRRRRLPLRPAVRPAHRAGDRWRRLALGSDDAAPARRPDCRPLLTRARPRTPGDGDAAHLRQLARQHGEAASRHPGRQRQPGPLLARPGRSPLGAERAPAAYRAAEHERRQGQPRRARPMDRVGPHRVGQDAGRPVRQRAAERRPRR
jgi:patatin-related protein